MPKGMKNDLHVFLLKKEGRGDITSVYKLFRLGSLDQKDNLIEDRLPYIKPVTPER